MEKTELSKEDAIALFDSKWWLKCSDHDIVMFQLFEKRLCMEFSEFHRSLESCLGRPVFTHELGLNIDGIKKEFLGEKSPPTFDEIINLIPEEKRIIINL